MEFDANLIAPALGVLGLLIVFFIYQWIKKQPSGSGAVQKIGEQIQWNYFLINFFHELID